MPRARMLTALVVTMMFIAAGCSSGPASITIRPATGNVAFAQAFNQAYCGKTKDGSYQCVLMAEDASTKTPAKSTGKALSPSENQPLRQVMHVNVLWRPLNGTRDSAVANATIDWYVLSNTTDGKDDLLLYQGSGFVTLSPDDKTTKVTIRSGEMRPAMMHGRLSDPIGDATISGTFVAINDTAKTNSLASATRERTAIIASGQ
jgi:hypothetical protein